MDKTLIGMEKSAGAVIRSCSVNKFFWTVVQNPQESTCAGVFFNEVSTLETCKFIKILKCESKKGVLLWVLRDFEEHLFCRVSANDCFSAS